MPGATALTETELPLIHAALARSPLRDETLVTLGLHTGFRVNELLALDVGHVWDGERVRCWPLRRCGAWADASRTCASRGESPGSPRD